MTHVLDLKVPRDRGDLFFSVGFGHFSPSMNKGCRIPKRYFTSLFESISNNGKIQEIINALIKVL